MRPQIDVIDDSMNPLTSQQALLKTSVQELVVGGDNVIDCLH